MGAQGMLKYDTVEEEIICPRCKSIFTTVQNSSFPATYTGSCYQCGFRIELEDRLQDPHKPLTPPEVTKIYEMKNKVV